MPDDERPDARDPAVADRLGVEPLDDVTRRRLVSAAIREAETADVDTPAPSRPSRTWRWLAAAAAVVVVAVGTLAVVTANRGDDEQQQATGGDRAVLAPKSTAAVAAPDVGDFGNLDEPANLDALRAALGQSFAASSAAPQASGDASTSERSAGGATADEGAAPSLCGAVVPDGSTIVAQGTGTLEGRRATVLLVESADGARSSDVVLEDPCELRHLP